MTSPGLPLKQRHVEGAQDERRPQVGSHRPSDDTSAEGVQHDGKEQEARPRGHVGDIGDPQAVEAAFVRHEKTRPLGFILSGPPLSSLALRPGDSLTAL